jgi:hypothetical protein
VCNMRNGRIYTLTRAKCKTYGRDPWSVTLREEHRLRVFDNRTQRKKFGSKNEWSGEDYITLSFMI